MCNILNLEDDAEDSLPKKIIQRGNKVKGVNGVKGKKYI